MITTELLRKLIEDKKVTIGASASTRALKSGALKKLVLASNAPSEQRDSFLRAAGIAGVEVETLSVPNDTLGVMCKKPFSISVLGIKK